MFWLMERCSKIPAGSTRFILIAKAQDCHYSRTLVHTWVLFLVQLTWSSAGSSGSGGGRTPCGGQGVQEDSVDAQSSVCAEVMDKWRAVVIDYGTKQYFHMPEEILGSNWNFHIK